MSTYDLKLFKRLNVWKVFLRETILLHAATLPPGFSTCPLTHLPVLQEKCFFLSSCHGREAQLFPFTSCMGLRVSCEDQRLHSPSTSPLEKSPQQRNINLEFGRNGKIEEEHPYVHTSVGYPIRPPITNCTRIMKEKLSPAERTWDCWPEGRRPL